MEFLPIKRFQERQIAKNNSNKTSTLISSMTTIKEAVMEKKKDALCLKDKGNLSFQRKKFHEAEEYYSEAIEICQGLSTLWTNRAICRNRMGKYEAAISDCEFALLLTRKDFLNNHYVCNRATENIRKAIVQKGNALLGLNKLDKAEQCFESLRIFGKKATGDSYVKKVQDAKMIIMGKNANELIYSKLQIEDTPQREPNENKTAKKNKSKFKSKKSKRKSK